MKFINKIVKWLPFFVLYFPFKIFSFIFQRKNIFLFGTGTGLYHDNSKYLFNYILEYKSNYKNYQAYWITSNKKTYKKLIEQNKPVLYKNSLKATYYASKAKAYFITAEIFDVFWYINDNTKLIQLWHGIPIKPIGYDYPLDVINIKKKEKFFSKNYQFSRFDYFIIDNIEYKELFKSAFKLEDSKIKCYGQPRNEIFYDIKVNKDKIKQELELVHFDKIILYAPTFRSIEEDNIILLEQIFSNRTNFFLEENNFCLLIKAHPFVSNLDILDKIQTKHILNFSKFNDIQELLLVSDALITDISSCAIDYLFFKEDNLYLFFPDIEKYKEDRFSFYKKTFNKLVRESTKINSVDQIIFNDTKVKRKNHIVDSRKRILELCID